MHRLFTMAFVLGFIPQTLLAQDFKIAFGSCASQNHPLPIFDTLLTHKPDLFIFLGDNIYGDTDSEEVLRAKYKQLAEKESFKRLKTAVPIIALWDDHDYGRNDAGREYEMKYKSKEIFLDFFGEPKRSDRWIHDGIYTSYIYDYKWLRIQCILLDNRTFRDELKLYNGEFAQDKRYFYALDYAPHTDTTRQFLGETQWKWLEQQLQVPADLRIICSGSQFGIEYNGYEAWANFPHEQRRMLRLIQKTKANGVMFLSGDVHYGEISKLQVPGMYPIYDVTSSGLSSTWHFATPNSNRIEGPIMENHFGLLKVDVSSGETMIRMELWDIRNNQRVEYSVPLKSLRFPQQ